mgnify:CR=1 FL=1
MKTLSRFSLILTLLVSSLCVTPNAWARNENYLRFINKSDAAQNFYINFYSSDKWGNHEYTTGARLLAGTGWVSIVTKSNISIAAGDSIMIRVKDGKTLTALNTSSAYNYFNLTAGSWEVKGDLLTLIAVDEPANRAIPAGFGTHTFLYLFKGSTKLISAEHLKFPDHLNVSCCDQMFSGCTGLITAPQDMSNIVEIPEFGLNKLFSGCSAMTTPPVYMPSADSIGSKGMSNMFASCYRLTDLSSMILPASKLGPNAYEYMFSTCVSPTSGTASKGLTKAPQIMATSMGDYAMQYMFNKCSLLTDGPDTLHAITLKKCSYYYMFNGCAAMTYAPVMMATSMPVATTDATGAMGYMFNCAATALKWTTFEYRATSCFDNNGSYNST